MAYILQKCRV